MVVLVPATMAAAFAHVVRAAYLSRFPAGGGLPGGPQVADDQVGGHATTSLPPVARRIPPSRRPAVVPVWGANALATTAKFSPFFADFHEPWFFQDAVGSALSIFVDRLRFDRKRSPTLIRPFHCIRTKRAHLCGFGIALGPSG